MTDANAIHSRRIPLPRVCTLIDSIYAFSMTLLVITVDIPSKFQHDGAAMPVQSILLTDIPDILHYFIAFILLALLWYFEHQRFQSLDYLDRPLFCMNIAGLAFVCLIPFTTNLAGDYPADALGAILFEANIFVIGAIAAAQWFYIRRRSAALVPGLTDAHIAREIRWSLVFPILSVAGIALSFVYGSGSIAIYLLAPVIMAGLFWHEEA